MAQVLAQARDQVDTVLDQQLLHQGLRDGAFVAEELAEEAGDAAEERGNGVAVVDLAAGEAQGQQVATVVDHYMQLEAVEPAERGFTPSGVGGEHALARDAGVGADGERRGVDESDPRAGTELSV